MNCRYLYLSSVLSRCVVVFMIDSGRRAFGQCMDGVRTSRVCIGRFIIRFPTSSGAVPWIISSGWLGLLPHRSTGKVQSRYNDRSNDLIAHLASAASLRRLLRSSCSAKTLAVSDAVMALFMPLTRLLAFDFEVALTANPCSL